MSAKNRVARWVRPDIRGLTAYPVPDASGLIKLDAMENPWVWPEGLRDAWAAQVRALDVNRYPDPQARTLTQRIREHDAIPDRYRVLLGNGSDEIIQMLALALGGSGHGVLAPEPSFVMYRMIATFCGMPYHGVPLCAESFALDEPAMVRAIEEHEPAIVYIAVPNNPTGNLMAGDAIERVIRAAPGLVVVDEAYTAFASRAHLELLDRHDNLLIMRTLSKLGLAGLRVGYLVGAPAWLDELEKVRLPYNVNVLSQAAAAFALENHSVLAEQTARIVAERARLAGALSEMPLTVWPSEANFLLVRPESADALQVHAGLRDAGILVKCLHGAHPLLSNCLRLTIGKPAENDALLEALAELLR